MSHPPSIVIVGRPNVGKSSLLNTLARRRLSIVDPTAGVTRDRVTTVVDAPAGPDSRAQVELVDTGGYGIDDAQDLTAQIQRQIELAIAQAQLILFVVDAQAGVVPLDREVARLLRRSDTKVPVVLVANKTDSTKHEAAAMESVSLGFGPPVTVSATTGYHTPQLWQIITQHTTGKVGAHTSGPAPAALLAIAGKRNAGKSTLVNALARQQRVIVSELAGTTRDSVDVCFEMDGQTLIAIDTAGVRKTKSLSGDIEYYSHHRTLRSIRRADVVLLLIDAAVPVSQVDTQLAGEILKHHKPCVIVLNKWDLAQDRYSQEQYARYLEGALPGLGFAPLAFVSAKNSQGLRPVVETAMDLYRQAGRRVPTAQLNQVMQTILAQNTPRSKIGRHPKIYYATQLAVHPPTIGLFVNNAKMFDPAYRRFLINRFRQLLPFAEVPIKLLVRGKKTAPTGALPHAAQSSLS